ncbi:MAG: chromate transporter [Bacillota bacterium]|nr:chromate transporter [Bacillota bacterium]
MATILLSLYWSFLKVGLFTIGGGYAMIPLMEAEVINVHGWLTASEFLDIIAVAEMTPGPVSINAATFIGYRLAGVIGSLTASLGVITPSLVLLLLLSRILFKLIQNQKAASFLNGLRSALIALILLASFTLGQTAVIDFSTALIFGLILSACILRPISPLYYIAAGALLGLILFPY